MTFGSSFDTRMARAFEVVAAEIMEGEVGGKAKFAGRDNVRWLALGFVLVCIYRPLGWLLFRCLVWFGHRGFGLTGYSYSRFGVTGYSNCGFGLAGYSFVVGGCLSAFGVLFGVVFEYRRRLQRHREG